MGCLEWFGGREAEKRVWGIKKFGWVLCTYRKRFTFVCTLKRAGDMYLGRWEKFGTFRMMRTPEMVLATGLHIPCRPLMGKVPGKPYVIDALNDVFMFYVEDGKLRYRFVYTLIRDF